MTLLLAQSPPLVGDLGGEGALQLSELFNPQSLDAYADSVYSQNSNALILLFKPLTQEEISSLDPATLQAILGNSTSVPEPSDILGILAVGAWGGTTWLKRKKKQSQEQADFRD